MLSARKCSNSCVTSCQFGAGSGSEYGFAGDRASGLTDDPDLGIPMKDTTNPDYVRLYASELNDMEPDLCLPAALFLYALTKVRTCEDASFETMCRRFVPYWRIRLQPVAMTLIAKDVKTRLAALGQNHGGKQ